MKAYLVTYYKDQTEFLYCFSDDLEHANKLCDQWEQLNDRNDSGIIEVEIN